MTIKYFAVIICLLCSVSLMSQGVLLGVEEEEPIAKIEVNAASLYTKVAQSRSSSMSLPFERLGYGEFTINEDQMLAPDFAKARPDIKTYVIQSVQDQTIKGRLLLTPESSWGTILTPQGLVSFYPYKGEYYLEKGIQLGHDHRPSCGNTDIENNMTDWAERLKSMSSATRVNFFNGGTRRNFSVAIVCTGEYYQANGNSDNAVTGEIAATVSALNVIYENELSVILVPLTPVLFSNPASDPFTPDMSGGDSRPVQAAEAVNMNFSVNSYDIGHVFHTHEDGDGWSNGGVAYLGSVCRTGSQSCCPSKAGGWSGAYSNTGNGWISLAAHEFGHMFGATHTFNGAGESCQNAISETSAYEIGSGTSIMSYQGICLDAQNIPSSGEMDNYFHVHSLSQMVEYVNVNGSCATEVPLNNTAPVVTAKPCAGEVRIPKNTPFVLTGSAQDAEDENLTYTWEQYDEDGPGTLTQGFIGSQAANSSIAPLFRSFPPGPSPTRYFPQMNTIIAGIGSDVFDVLPNRARTLNFQLTVRDNNPAGGGVASNEMQVIVDNSGPLSLTNISSVTAGEPFTVNWTLNGTEELCDVADILLSLDGGQSYTVTLAEDVEYGLGTFELALPAAFPSSDKARIMLKCSDAECYAFFDVMNNDISIISDCLAGSSIICDTEYEVFEQGDPSLDLDLSHFDGTPITSINRVINDFISTLAPIALFDQSGGCNLAFNSYSNTANIVVDKTGEYTFTIDVNANGGRGYFTIYEADTYVASDPCSSFVGASAIGNAMGFFIQPTLTVTLEECKDYLLIISNNASAEDMPITTEITNITGPGTVIELDDSPDPDYDHTFIAVDETGVIEAVSPTSNFMLLAGGLYDIYTVTYKASGATPPEIVDPSAWLGSSLADVLAMDCLLLSVNKKQILVEFSCRINSIEVGMQSACDPLNNFYSQELIITYEDPPLSGNLTVNGTPFPITGSPQTVTLVGQPADGMSYDVSVAFSDIPSCMKFVADLYTAPENCCPIELELGEDIEVCDFQDVILDAGMDGNEFKWFRNGDELMHTESTLEVVESGFYLVEVVTATGCTKTDTVNVLINPSPIVELGEDISVCEDEIFIIQANTNAPNLIWSKDNVELQNETGSSLLINDGGTYILTGSNGVGCTIMDTIIIEYVTRPVVDLGDDQQFCEGDPAYTLDAGMDGTQYTWSRNSTILLSETNNMLDVTESGQYTVVVDRGGGCDARDTVDIEFIELGEVFAGNDINVCEGSSEQLISFIEADSYEWFFNGSLFSDQSESPTVTEAGEYVLVGQNEIGCESTDTAIVTVVQPPQVDLGEDRVGCLGSEIMLSVDSIGTILWVFNNDFYSMNATISVTEPGDYIASVIAASNCIGRDTINVTFVPGPTLELGDDKDFCMGENDVITANTDGDNITWFLDDVEIAGETDFELTVTEAGEYKAVVTGTANCEVEDYVTVTVYEVPDLVLGEDEVICDGESVLLMTDFAAVAYDWQYNNSSISDQPSVIVSDAGTYTLTVINEFGCSDSDDIEVYSNASPTLELEESYSICEGEDVEVIATSDAASFQWFVNGEELIGETGNSITVDSESTIDVIARSVDGCPSEGSTQVNAAPSPSVDLGEDFSLCPSESFVLNAGNHASYLWSTGQVTSTINIISVDPQVASQESYSVTVTNEDGCTAEDTIFVEFFPVVMGDVMASASGVCNGEPVQLLASGGTSYLWVDPNETLSNIEGPSALASPTQTTTYQVIIEDDCPNNSETITIEIEVFEAGMDVSAGEDDCAVNGNTLELNATGGVEYEWEDNETIISGANTANPIVRPIVDTVYFVNITDANGCVFRDSVNVCLLDDPLENFKLVTIITPNGDGDNDELIFEGLEAFPENVLTIYNRWGYPVFERKRYQSDSELWNGENGGDILPADTYYYVLTFDDKTYKSTVTIMR